MLAAGKIKLRQSFDSLQCVKEIVDGNFYLLSKQELLTKGLSSKRREVSICFAACCESKLIYQFPCELDLTFCGTSKFKITTKNRDFFVTVRKRIKIS